MVAVIKVSGLGIKWMELALSNGSMVEYTKVLSDVTKKRVMEWWDGQMEKFMMANGKTENSMEKAISRIRLV
jgi:hypothetical protein